MRTTPRTSTLTITIVGCLLIAMLASTGTASANWRSSAHRMLLGVSLAPRGGETNEEYVQRVEREEGRKMGAIRVYLNWDYYKSFPTPFHTWLAQTDHRMYMSVRSIHADGTPIPWASIAAAKPGSALYNQMLTWADELKGYGKRIFFTFNHEPEEKVNDPMGTPADFVAAWRKIVTVFRQQGVTNLRYVWIMTDWAFSLANQGSSDDRNANNWYPGDAYVDQIAADPYNWYTCRSTKNPEWRSLAQLAAPLKNWGAQHPDKALAFTEFGSVEDPSDPGRKASWLDDAATLFQQPGYQQFRAILYFNSRDQNYAPCTWYLNSSQSAMNAFAHIGEMPWLQRNMS
jgi:hypothetical protein